VRPGRDEKILAGWNGLMVRGLAFASRVFDRPDWLALAAGATDFLLKEMWEEGQLWRSHQEGQRRIPGLMEDYGDVAAGLTALYQATFDARYLQAAVEVAEAAHARFWDGGQRAWLAAPKGQADLAVPTYALFDNAWPSGASTLTEANVALAALTGEERWRARAEVYLTRMREALVDNPMAYGHLWLAADAFLEGTPALVVAGGGVSAARMLEALAQTYAPHVAVSLARPDTPVPPAAALHAGKHPLDGGGAAGYLCHHFTCEAPLTSPEALRARLAPASAPAAPSAGR